MEDVIVYNGRHISKRIAKLLVVIVVRRILARGLEVLLSDAVPCLRPLARNNHTNAKERETLCDVYIICQKSHHMSVYWSQIMLIDILLDDASGTYTTTASPVAMTTPSPPVTTPAAALIVTTGN